LESLRRFGEHQLTVPNDYELKPAIQPDFVLHNADQLSPFRLEERSSVSERVTTELVSEARDRRTHALDRNASATKFCQQARLDQLSPCDDIRVSGRLAKDRLVLPPASLVSFEPAASGSSVQTDETINVRIRVDRTVKQIHGHASIIAAPAVLVGRPSRAPAHSSDGQSRIAKRQRVREAAGCDTPGVIPSAGLVEALPVRQPPRNAILAGVAIGTLAVLAVVRVVAGVLVPSGTLPDRVQDALTLAMSVLIESLPFVVLGILVSIAVRVWLPEGLVLRVLPRSPWMRRLVLSVLGMLLPVCECGNVPVARGLIARGLTAGDSMTFLFAAPLLNPITIITTVQAFGLSDGVLVARIAGGFAIANLLGWLFGRHPDPESLLTARFAAECRLPEHGEHGSPWRRSVQLFATESASLLPALFVGAAGAALVQTLVPRSVLVGLGSDPVWSVLAMIVLSFVISVCSTVDAFFILPFAATFLPGSIVAFLIFGALIDVRMIALLRTTFRSRTVLQVLLVILLATAALAWGVNLLA